MIVQARPEKLRQTKVWEVALRFGFGGLCTVLAGMVAKHFGPAVGGLFLAFPAIFPSGASLIESHEEKRKKANGMEGRQLGRRLAGVDATGATMGCVGLAMFAGMVWRGLPRHGAAVVIAGATAAWAAASIGVWWTMRRSRAVRALRRR